MTSMKSNSGSGKGEIMPSKKLIAILCVSVATLLFHPGWSTSQSGDGKPAEKVTLLRTPGKGIQPQTVLDDKGVLHLIYFSGVDGAGDIFYVRSENAGGAFSKPLRVNSQPGSAIAIGNIRGAH